MLKFLLAMLAALESETGLPVEYSMLETLNQNKGEKPCTI